ncbi:ABC transporter substrate-binding protein [Granulicoccus phenolivorans]|uniref:ABC transporter substrate-binding protein n=1 Tax=Granulicoccus phenolivorans TaxID=266854 RepID=UPI000420139B|nr:ABC transporter substrate-binding protein [Granulicoccus phenolivorans]
MKRIAPVLLALLTALGVLGLSGCANAAAGSGSKVTINYGQLGSAKLIEALLEASGQTPTDYRVDYKLFPAGPGFLEAVASDSVDVGITADTPAIFAQANQIPVKAVGVARTVREDRAYVTVLAQGGSALQSAADLRGKKVATTEATILQYTLIQVLAGAGLTLNDIQVVNLPPADALAAFRSGDVDAITSVDPQLSQLELSGARSIADGRGVTSGYSYVLATDKALADPGKTAAIEDLLQRIRRGYAWAHANPEAWATKYTALTGLKPEVARAVLARENFTFVPIDDAVIAEQQKQADVYHAQGLLRAKLDVSAEYDTRFNDTLTGGN